MKGSTNYLQTGLASTSFIVNQLAAFKDTGVYAKEVTGVRRLLNAAEIYGESVIDSNALQDFFEHSFRAILHQEGLASSTINSYMSAGRKYLRLVKMSTSPLHVNSRTIVRNANRIGQTQFDSRTNTIIHTRTVNSQEASVLQILADIADENGAESED